MIPSMYTPRPWKLEPDGTTRGALAVWADDQLVARLPAVGEKYNRSRSAGLQEGNSKLVQAAPNMAEALHFVTQILEHDARCGTVDGPGEQGMVTCVRCVARNALLVAGFKLDAREQAIADAGGTP